MLKKRLVGVVTVKNDLAVQSFAYGRYLPLGKPEYLVENLNRWGADEILVQVIDRSTNSLGPDFKLIEKLGRLGLGTPLIYSGGIHSVYDGVRAIELGADRIIVDALLHGDLSVVKNLSNRLGAQALIASLPVSWDLGVIKWLDYRKKSSTKISDQVLSLIASRAVSEVLVSDWEHDGGIGEFDLKIVDDFPLKSIPIIAFGGISDPEKMRILLQSTQVVAIAIGNFLSYREHALQKYKELLNDMPVRQATYQTTFRT